MGKYGRWRQRWIIDRRVGVGDGGDDGGKMERPGAQLILMRWIDGGTGAMRGQRDEMDVSLP